MKRKRRNRAIRSWHLFLLFPLLLFISHCRRELPGIYLPQIAFEKTYGDTSGDWSWSVRQTSDGGYIITGRTESYGAGEWDVYLIKTNSSGDTLWTRTYGGTSRDEGRSVQQTLNGGYIIAGWTQSFGVGLSDVYLIKTNSSGDTLWTRTYGGSAWDVAHDVQETYDGGFIIVGITGS
ncbi:hypothetical protein IIA15_08395, partial [candidate division TA06 bacterium]|nr:hypothetical protein [candidate division TA06 bacterium]